ncbi:MAG: choice-of-anchor S family protein [Candidatus Thorarchaeota archaeon]
MKKIALLLIILTCSAIFVEEKPSLAINVGDSFTYQITEAEHYIKTDDIEIKNIGFIQLLNFPKNTELNISILEKGGGVISYTVIVDNITSYYYLSTNWLDSRGLDYSIFTLLHSLQITSDYHNGYLLELYLYQILPYLEPQYNDYILTPNKLSEDIIETFQYENNSKSNVYCNFKEEKDGEKVFYESWVGGNIKSSYFGSEIAGIDYAVDIKFGNNWHFVIGQLTGIVYGFGIRGWCEGKINNKNIRIAIKYEYQMKDFELSDYTYGRYKDFLRRTNMIIAIVVPTSSLLILGSIFFYIKSKQKKK